MTELFAVSLRDSLGEIHWKTVNREELGRILDCLTDVKGLTFTVIKK
jgi:hypothetical protein